MEIKFLPFIGSGKAIGVDCVCVCVCVYFHTKKNTLSNIIIKTYHKLIIMNHKNVL